MKWKSYDPAWLVELAGQQMPDEPWLAEALKNCTNYCKESRAYIYFVDPSNPNKPGSEWQFKENITLEHPKEGDLVLDILMDGRVGGVEFLSKL